MSTEATMRGGEQSAPRADIDASTVSSAQKPRQARKQPPAKQQRHPKNRLGGGPQMLIICRRTENR
jgi:hypothetical protein